jgi:glycine cleavage system regulatory protein
MASAPNETTDMVVMDDFLYAEPTRRSRAVESGAGRSGPAVRRGLVAPSAGRRPDGKFAGIVCVSVSETHLEALTAAMASLPGLRITFEVSRSPAAQAGNRRLKLSLVGHDRIGIVREVSQVLARHALNVEDLNTYTASAPMSAGVLFHATAELTASSTLDVSELTRDLENLSNDLMVDITLDETIRS